MDADRRPKITSKIGTNTEPSNKSVPLPLNTYPTSSPIIRQWVVCCVRTHDTLESRYEILKSLQSPNTVR